MTIGELILDFRTRQNISQRKFAIMCGMSNTYISNLESGINPKTGVPVKPSIDALKTLAKVMGMSFDELLNMIDEDTVISLTPEEQNQYVREMTRQLRDNPKLRLLFDKTSKMSDKDMDAVLGIVSALMRENDN